MTRFFAITTALALLTSHAAAVDLERFDFGDPNGTQLSGAANSANPGNQWTYAEEATVPGDAATGDVSDVNAGVYRVLTDSEFAPGLESRYLDIGNVASGQVYLAATLSSWNFISDGSSSEQLRFTFLDDDTGTSGSTVTAQMQIRRNTTTDTMELFGDAIGTAGSFDIANTLELPNNQTNPFTMVLAIDKDSNSFEVFYKDGSNPSQSLGLGGVSRVRDANSVRMVTNNFGAENFPEFNVFNEFANIDSIVLSDTNPLTDLITLEVNRTTGAMTLINTSGAAVGGVTGVTLDSSVGAIDLTDFTDFSGTLAIGQSVSLDASPGSAPGLWVLNPVEDVTASLSISGGDDRTVNVNFVGNGGAKWIEGDLDFDGTIDADDYVILTDNAESDLSGLSTVAAYQVGDLNGDGFNNAVDFGIFKDTFIAANSPAAFARLVAGVPEPSTLLLAAAGMPLLTLRRRRRSASQRPAPMRSTQTFRMRTSSSALPLALIALVSLLSVEQANALIIEDFQFDDPFGTSYDAAANSANPGNLLSTDTTPADLSGVATNGAGALNASLKANNNFGTTLVDTADLTTGTIFGVMELTWDFQSPLDAAENEEIRLTLISSGTSGVLAEWEIQREDDDTLTMLGNTVGGTDISAQLLNGGSLTQSTKFIGVVEVNLDADTYAVYYSSDAGANFTTLGTGTTDPTRNLDKMRIVMNNDLSDDSVLIDRVYLTDERPIPNEPDLLKLVVHPKSGHVAIVNDTGTVFDIDYYRILSGDDSLEPSLWRSLEDRATDAVDGPDGGTTAGDGVGETWTEAGGSDTGVLSESFLLSSSVVSENEALPLGAAFDLTGDSAQLEFEYRDAVNEGLFTGVVEVVELLPGDFNVDGTVDIADYTVWRDNVSGLFTPSDYTTWVNNFGSTLGSGTAIPEPASTVLLLIGTGWLARRR